MVEIPMYPCTDISNELFIKRRENGNKTLTGKKKQ